MSASAAGRVSGIDTSPPTASPLPEYASGDLVIALT